ncbi:TPA: DDE-type integrase/transposase/recombinase [Pseudomonas aeruginosa]|nr:DDE-type integrase/transposase/recombinase [Pseudomonas aeruginosa]
MAVSAVITQRLVDLDRQLQSAGQGQRTALCKAAAAELGLSLASLYRKLKDVQVRERAPRKRRKDSGQSRLGRDEALVISTALIHSARHNAKRLYSVADAVEDLRASGLIRAESVDRRTGEIRPMSISAISRALHSYRLHPSQLLAPEPVTELRSLHPNHVWQIDASLCVLYYLKPGANKKASGLQVMDRKEFYKNKPANLDRVAADRVWSYEITDHYTGWIYVRYVMGAESGENFCTVLIEAMQERGGADMLHGVPRILMMDPGSANISAMSKNLCCSLGIEVIVHAPGAARVTGSVENARNIIERKFESKLKFEPVNDLDELNAQAKKWRAHFNATAVHSRHRRTRSELWMTIRADQLIKAPTVELCRELAVRAPESRKVTAKLRVSFGGYEYDISVVPDVNVNDRVLITRNPWREDAVQLVTVNEQGRQVFYVLPKVEKDEGGYATTSPVIGQTFSRQAEIPAQKARKAVDQLAYGVESETEVQAARKAKAVPFGGALKPFQHIDDTQLPTFMPRRGTEHSLVAPIVEVPLLPHVEAAKRLRAQLGEAWTTDSMAWLKRTHPEGVPEDQLDAIANQLRKPARPGLRVVGGN